MQSNYNEGMLTLFLEGRIQSTKAEGNEVRVDVSQLPAGNYFVKVRTEGKIRTRKIAVGR